MASIATVTEPPNRPEPVASAWHTVGFLALMFGGVALQVLRIVPFRVHTRAQLYAFTIAFEFLMVVYVWGLGLRPRGKTLRDLIGGKWNNPAAVLMDIAVAILFGMIVIFVLLVLNYALGPNPAAARALKVMGPQNARDAFGWILVSSTAGFCEEFLFRGYFQRQLAALTGHVGFAVPLQAIIFGLGHLYQGWKGAVAITVYGTMFGALAVMRKSLRPGMLQHAGYDSFVGVTALLLTKYNRWPPGLL